MGKKTGDRVLARLLQAVDVRLSTIDR